MKYLIPFLLLSTAAFAQVSSFGDTTGSLVTSAPAAVTPDPRVTCPSPDPCKVILLTTAEEKILLDDKGILSTAAQARQLDLGALATYFQQKIAKAPAGDAPKPAEPPK